MRHVIPMQLLEAALLCAAKTDVRFYLQGVAISKGHLVSTDGHRGFAAPVRDMPEDIDVIIPSEAIQSFMRKHKPSHRKGNCVFSYDGAEGEIQSITGDIRETFRLIDAKYPDWERVFPRSYSIENAKCRQFNWQYLVDAQKMSKILGGSGTEVYIYPQENPCEAAHVVLNTPDFSNVRMVIMPLRDPK